MGVKDLSRQVSDQVGLSGCSETTKISSGLKVKIAKQATKSHRENTDPENSFQKLPEKLKEKKLEYATHIGELEEVVGLSYHDPDLAPSENEVIQVLEADVTHSVFEARCGLEKLSVWSVVTPDRKIKPVGNSLSTSHFYTII